MTQLGNKMDDAGASGELFIRRLFAASQESLLHPRRKPSPHQAGLEDRLIADLKVNSPEYYRRFVFAAVATMSSIVRANLGSTPEALSRAFDRMDEVFGLNYRREDGVHSVNPGGERLYEGTGVGVQTSYAMLIEVLERIDPPARASIIDLGSGYGRLGLVSGLWRADITFAGYEFVSHRVQLAGEAAQRSGISDRVKFHHQDLRNGAFQIPEADVYYMYDPFSDDTYERVLGGLRDLGRRRSIAIVTKGIPPERFSDFVKKDGFAETAVFDGGNVRLLRNQPSGT